MIGIPRLSQLMKNFTQLRQKLISFCSIKCNEILNTKESINHIHMIGPSAVVVEVVVKGLKDNILPYPLAVKIVNFPC